MPAKFRIKEYQTGGVYHIYNKGVDGREIFCNDADFEKFEETLGKYLDFPPKEVSDNRFKSERPYRIRHKQEMNLAEEVELWSYCLMPNHFHLLVKQVSNDGIVKLMRRVITYYVMYFNQKYHRQGSLFTGVYKAVRLDGDNLALSMSRYIHLNPVQKVVKRFGPVETVTGIKPEDYLYSSFQCYIKKRELSWVKMSSIKNMCLKDYVEYVNDSKTPVDEGIEKFVLE